MSGSPALQRRRLVSRAPLDQRLRPNWHTEAAAHVTSQLLDRSFPCIFSRNAARKGIIEFLFVDHWNEIGVRELFEGLTQYVHFAEVWDGSLDSASPLVVIFARECTTARSVEEFHAFGWQVLQAMHDLDPDPWPSGIARDPRSPGWTMCLRGMELFCNMSSPAHRVRRSRNLGDHFSLVVNPRQRFDLFAGDNPSGRNVRRRIRERVASYDGLAPAEQLGTYGGGTTLEWWQYGLTEDNGARTDVCPFRPRSDDPDPDATATGADERGEEGA